ncbi:MAG: ROK family protein [Actinomycetota bacterium]|nr:ROK family protein [Actinomycetota bacterium]
MTVCYLAIDVGSAKLAAAIVSDQAEVLVRDRVATPQRDVWPAVARLVKRVLAAAPNAPVACGVGCGGPMNAPERTVSPLYIPSMVAFPLAAEVEALTGLPTAVDNNAKTVALGESWCGAAVGLNDFVSISMSSGVGGGIVSGGRLLEGRLGNAGHIGHIVVEPEGRPCPCGGKGCLEAYCSGRAIEEETGRPPQRAPQSIVERTGIFVGRALASLGAITDLRAAVIGGSVALGFGDPFFAAVQAEVDQRARLTFTQGFRVIPGGLGQLAPLIGAAALARGVEVVR